jgi:hypothetical protein
MRSFSDHRSWFQGVRDEHLVCCDCPPPHRGQKLENDPKKPEWIITVSRLGYRFEGYYSIRSKLKLEVLSHNRLTAGAFRPTSSQTKAKEVLTEMRVSSIFTPEYREYLRGELVAAANADTRIVAAAHLGSAALDRLDRWSDVDMALCLSPDADLSQVLHDWTTRLYDDYAAAATYDVRRGAILYRVFLLDNTLQVDLSFWRPHEFRAIGEQFKLIFGTANDPLPSPAPESGDLIGMAWLYALHARSSIARRCFLQAEYMLSGMRDNVLALACKRHGVAAVQGRGLDDLPQEVRGRAADSLVGSLDPAELIQALRLTTAFLQDEISYVDTDLASRLAIPMEKIVSSLLGDCDGETDTAHAD